MLSATEAELVDKLDLYLPEVRTLIDAVAKHVAQPHKSALRLLQPAVPATLPTGLPTLDRHLGGGLPRGAVTELVGPASVGKTQLCLAVAARALVDGASTGAKVLYVDTEGSFSPSRLLQLLLALGCGERAAHGAGGDTLPAQTTPVQPAAEELLQRVTVLRPSRWAEYCTCLEEMLEDLLLDPPRTALLVVDSIAMAVLRHFGQGGDIPRRQAAVGAHAARLKQYADAHGLCILCVNQVSGGSGAHGPTAEGDIVTCKAARTSS